ncbi:MAG TPA: serine/threonine-protein kinase [Sandaracinaceae bacterium]
MSAGSRDTLSDAELPDGGATLRPDAPGASVDGFGDLGPGSTVGERYLLERELGRGTTGIVFEASHLVIGKRVALKCLHPQHSWNATAVARFFREAKIAATVEHPNVIAVFDGGRDGDVLFIAMERLEGESLGDRLDRGPLPLAQAVELFLGIADGVAAVHEKGVVHRDLKPDNIFLAVDRSGALITPKVLDFGISKLKEPGLRELTTMGVVMGTPFYMAPEQIASSRDVDVRADVYSLGVMLYEALMGEVPYANDSVLDLFQRAKSGDPRPFEAMREELPEDIVRIVEKAMRPDRADRFASVAELRDALRAVPIVRRDTDPPPERDHRATLQDVPSPLAGPEPVRRVAGRAPEPVRLEEAVTPHRVDLAPDAPDRIEARPTIGHGPIVVARVPSWVWLALAAAALTTLGALGLALAALLV